MSLGPYPLGAAFATGFPLASVTTRARQAAYPVGAVAQVRSLWRPTDWGDAAADGADTATAVAAAAAATATVRARRLIGPPGRSERKIHRASTRRSGRGKVEVLSTTCKAGSGAP